MSNTKLATCAALLTLCVTARPVVAQTPAAPATPAQRGRDIALRANRQLKGYGDAEADVTIVLKTRRGDPRVWSVRLLSLERPSGERTIVVFEEPRDVRGTALLTIAASGRDDEQWLYLPAIGRVKRIASQNRSGAFMGTEFSYEDIAADDAEKYRYGAVREDTLDGVPVTVVERYPLDAASSYRRQLLWIDRDYRPLRIDYYDRSDAPLKTLSFRGYRLRAGRFWRPDEMEMVNHQTLASTTLRWNTYRFGVGLSARDFEPAALDRAR